MGIRSPVTRLFTRALGSRVVTPFEGDGVWLRCALHAHTTNSDGEMAPDMLVRHYEWAGYDVLAITDHWVRTVERVDAEAARHPVDGAERACAARARCARARARRRGRSRAARRRSRRSPEVVAWILENGGVPYLAHTYWSGLRTEQWEACEGLVGIEVWNTGCELEIGRGDSSVHWDEALEARARALRARDRRLAPPRLRQRLRVDDGARGGAVAGGGARRIAQRPLLRLDRPGDPRVWRLDDDARRRALHRPRRA